MTKQRNDSYSTEFGLWTRDQPEIDSKLGFVATDIDWMWRDYNTDRFLFIEEKRFMAEPEFWQLKSFRIIHKKCYGDKNYWGFYILQFENTCPDDGKIYIRHIESSNSIQEINRAELIEFLNFNTFWSIKQESWFIKTK